MRDYETTIIPLEEAHEILTAFRIDGSNSAYQRCKRPHGFRWCDLEAVLNTSRLVLSVDWREWLQDAVDTIIEQLAEFEIAAAADLGTEGVQGSITVAGSTESIKYVPNDDDDFDAVIAAVNHRTAGQAQYRKFRSCEGTDGWVYAVLEPEHWQSLDAAATQSVSLIFTSEGV